MNGSMLSSAAGAAVFNATASPVGGSGWEELGWSLLSAVLATVLSWLAGRKSSS